MVVPFSARLASRWFGGLWGRGLLYGVPARLIVSGREHVSPKKPYVVVVNHLSLMDIPILYGWLPLDFIWIMKKEVRKIPVIGIGTALLGHVFLDRCNHEAALRELEKLREHLPQGTSILFFPEGTRSRDGQLQEFKMGAFKIADDLQLPVLPITLLGTDQLLTPDGMDLHPGTAQMIIHPPIEIDDVRTLSVEELRDRSRAMIANALDRPTT